MRLAFLLGWLVLAGPAPDDDDDDDVDELVELLCDDDAECADDDAAAAVAAQARSGGAKAADAGLDQGLTAAPESPGLNLAAAKRDIEAGRPGEALKRVNKSLAKRRSASGLKTRAAIHGLLGDRPKAFADASEASKLKPQDKRAKELMALYAPQAMPAKAPVKPDFGRAPDGGGSAQSDRPERTSEPAKRQEFRGYTPPERLQAQARLEQASRLLNLGEPGEAARLAIQASTLGGGAAADVVAGRAQRKLGKNEEAAESATRALEKDGAEAADDLVARALEELERLDREDARLDAEAALRIAPGLESARRALERAGAATPGTALSPSRRPLRARPTVPQALTLRSEAYAALGNKTEADADAAAAERLQPAPARLEQAPEQRERPWVYAALAVGAALLGAGLIFRRSTAT